MRTTTGPTRVTALEVATGRALVVYRIVRSDLADDPVLLNSLRSNYELTREPRRVERTSTVIHMGVSMYLDPEMARRTAQRWSKREPVKLQAAVVDIQPVGT
jgi:hypothetical protein